MDIDDGKAREELLRLVPLVAAEGTKIMEAFADQQRLHHTDVEALTLLMVADAQETLLSAGALRGELGLTSGATTFVVNRLERAGLVKRVRDHNDQRKVFLHLSDAGRALADRFFSPVLRSSNAVMDQFTPAELKVAQRFLAATTAAMVVYRISLSRQP